ncbi:unnamed protein product, partial [Polarella glacialis]
MEVRMSAPLHLSSDVGATTAEADQRCGAAADRPLDAEWEVLGEPGFLTLQRLGRYPRSLCRHLGLRGVVDELRRRCLEPGERIAKRVSLAESFDGAWLWAQHLHSAGRFGSLTLDELAALRLCLAIEQGVGLQDEAPGCLRLGLPAQTLLGPLNTFLASLDHSGWQCDDGSRAVRSESCRSSLTKGPAEAAAASSPQRDTSSATPGSCGTSLLWETLLGEVMGGLTTLRLVPRSAPPAAAVSGASPRACPKVFRLAWVPQQIWDRHFGGQKAEGQRLRFTAIQSVAASEPWHCLELLEQGCVPCVFEFDEAIAREAVDVASFCGGEGAEASGAGPKENGFLLAEEENGVLGKEVRKVKCGMAEMLLPPFVRGVVQSISTEEAPAPYGLRVSRVRVAGLRPIAALDAMLDAPIEAILAGSLLLGLQARRAQVADEEERDVARQSEGSPEDLAEQSGSQALLAVTADCFRALSRAIEVKSPVAVDTVWMGYFECVLGESNPWKELNDSFQSGVLGLARAAVLGSARAAKGVTKRALGVESCVNKGAMAREFARRAESLERMRSEALGPAREQVAALGFETLTDPEAFLRFMQHDPIRALEAAPAVVHVYTAAAAPAQRVLLFAKLMSLTALAGGLLRGDQKVVAAFESALPLAENPWVTLSSALDSGQLLVPSLPFSVPDQNLAAGTDTFAAAGTNSAAGTKLATAQALRLSRPSSDSAIKEEQSRLQTQAAQHLVALLQLLRLNLARVRLLVLEGAPDAGKTTLLREVFGLRHLRAGLCEEGRTDQVTFELHPQGDRHFRPAFLVDTPGFGDGDQLHRN